jgi:hypothetical protein
MKDEEMWLMGNYIMSALDATVCNNSLWRGKNGKPAKYIEPKAVISKQIGLINFAFKISA